MREDVIEAAKHVLRLSPLIIFISNIRGSVPKWACS